MPAKSALKLEKYKWLEVEKELHFVGDGFTIIFNKGTDVVKPSTKMLSKGDLSEYLLFGDFRTEYVNIAKKNPGKEADSIKRFHRSVSPTFYTQ
jgi:hypothetical protein